MGKLIAGKCLNICLFIYNRWKLKFSVVKKKMYNKWWIIEY